MLDFLGSFFLLMPLFHQFPDGNSLDSFCLKPISHRSNFSSSLNPRFTETFHFQFISIMILQSWEMVRNWITGNHPKIVKYKLLFCPRDFMLAFETNSICEIQHCLLVLVQNDSPITSTKKCRKKCLVMEILSSVAKGVESIRILNSSIFSQHTYPQSEESKCKMCVIEKRTNLVGDTQCVKITFLVPKFCVNCDQLFSEKSQLFEF